MNKFLQQRNLHKKCDYQTFCKQYQNEMHRNQVCLRCILQQITHVSCSKLNIILLRPQT